jgi:hypothetical protein
MSPGLHRNRRSVSETVSRNYRPCRDFLGVLGDSGAKIYSETEQLLKARCREFGIASALNVGQTATGFPVSTGPGRQNGTPRGPGRGQGKADGLEGRPNCLQDPPSVPLTAAGHPPFRTRCARDYSAAASFSITTFKCAVTSLCSFTGTVNSPRDFSGSCSWILRRSTLNPFFTSASARSPDVTDPNS